MPLVITFPYSPIALHFWFITIRWYGVGYAVAFLVGLWLVSRYMRWRDIPEAAWGTLAFWCIVLGLVGARLYYDVQNGFGFYLTHPQDILAVWQGGMAYFGAVFSVPILVFIWTRVRRLPFWSFADAAALFAVIGQPIGRLGNIVNGDIVGYPSDLPWAMRYTNPQSLAPELGVAYQPAAAYELLIGLVMLAIVLLVWRYRHPRPGALFVLYLPMYAISQFIVFFWRANSVTAFGLKQAQLSAIVLFVLSLVIIALWRRFPNLNAGHRGREAELPEGEPVETAPEKAPASGD
ncbi:MAG: prolipoprotein diacylglyceryl transferase [Candidatus Dormibacteraeota bacterium]|nr:prolipoprotein diacylglyceryl transferase [Candidatus Dormibacteraeota bacterium]